MLLSLQNMDHTKIAHYRRILYLETFFMNEFFVRFLCIRQITTPNS